MYDPPDTGPELDRALARFFGLRPGPFSTSIVAAWRLIEHLRSLGWAYEVIEQDQDNIHYVRFRHKAGDRQDSRFGIGEAYTVPLAACRAARELAWRTGSAGNSSKANGEGQC